MLTPGVKLTLKTGQQLALSAQMLQSVQILQLSQMELMALVEQECEKNPLLEQEGEVLPSSSEDGSADSDKSPLTDEAINPGEDGNFGALITAHEGTQVDLDVSVEDYDPDVTRFDSRSVFSSTFEDDYDGVNNLSEQRDDLCSHLLCELQLLPMSPNEARLTEILVYCLQPTGYLDESLEDIARRVGSELWQLEDALEIIQSLTPAGIGARSLAECLRLQLKEADRLDPLMDAALDHLPLLAAADLSGLKAQGIAMDKDDMVSMLADLRRLDPKPGLRFSSYDAVMFSPDILVSRARGGGWQVMLNPDAQPHLLINHNYKSLILESDKGKDTRTFVRQCVQSATTLKRAVEQRADTLLKVASAVVKHQLDFLDCGLSGLKPLTLNQIADELSFHESTISRTVANKTILTPRGLFPLRYFFTHTIGGDGEGQGQAQAIESIKSHIRDLIDKENPARPLSDEKLVKCLAENNIMLARRTVTKYREAMQIGSSSQRRAQKKVESLLEHST